MNKTQLTEKAQALGINIEGLDTNDKLKEAIAQKQSELLEAEKQELLIVSKYLNIENADTMSVEDLRAAIEVAKQPKEKVVEKIVYKDKEEKAPVETKERKLPEFEYDGKTYTFSKRTPEKLNVLGVVYALEELVKNDDAIEFLVAGGNCFVELKR